MESEEVEKQQEEIQKGEESNKTEEKRELEEKKPEEKQKVKEKKLETGIELTRVEVVRSPAINSVEKHERESDEKGRNSSIPRAELIFTSAKSESWMSCLKYGLFVFNFLIWILVVGGSTYLDMTLSLEKYAMLDFKLLGAAITAVAIWIRVDPDFWNFQSNLDMKQFSTASNIGITVGVVILILGFLGCCGALMENIYMLVAYFIIALILVFLEAAAMGIVWAATSSKDMQEDLKARIKAAIDKRSERDDIRYFIDLLQAKLECCGVSGIADYESEALGKSEIPKSCTDLTTGVPHTKGCVDSIVSFLKSKASLLGGISIAILLLQFAAIVLSVCLCCGIRQATKAVF